MFNLNNANMENLITQINKERLVNSDTALMMKELYLEFKSQRSE